MLKIIKLLQSLLSRKSSRKIIMDSRLGKLVCEYKSNEKYFTWDAELEHGRGKEPISISIDGDLNGPYSNALHKAHEVVNMIPDLTYKIQKEIDSRFPEKKVDLSKDYNLEDIFVYVDEETKTVDFELEYCTEDAEVMISVEFVNDQINGIDFY